MSWKRNSSRDAYDYVKVKDKHDIKEELARNEGIERKLALFFRFPWYPMFHQSRRMASKFSAGYGGLHAINTGSVFYSQKSLSDFHGKYT